MADWVLLGLLGHCLQLVDQDLGIELARDISVESVDSLRDFLVFWLLEELSQGPGPVEPFGVDLGLLTVISPMMWSMVLIDPTCLA